jgi:tetratricopeptide (TPR) repeat protein
MGDQPLDLSITLIPPPSGAVVPGTGAEAIASIELRCDQQGLQYTGDLLADPLTPRERESLRWYLEEYVEWPYEQFLERARKIESSLPELGKRLYHYVCGSTGAMSVMQNWRLQPGIERQVSIVSALPKVLSLPWELLHDEQGFLVLRTRHPVSLIRRLPQRELAAFPTPFTPPLRILLVTARPEGTDFVDPRSIARELLDEVQSQVDAGTIVLEWLRPPTLPALRARLSDAAKPTIQVLHFDGHGVFKEGHQRQGLLAFEDEHGQLDLVRAEDVAQVLQDSGVRLAMLTACQSAMGAADDAFSSVAAQFIQSGVDAVIAMSASVLVISAARYAEAFYRALAAGVATPLAQERARQALHDDPRRSIHRRSLEDEGTMVTIRDWWLPHYYQQRPVSLQLTKAKRSRKQTKETPLPRLSKGIPSAPRYGFSGRAYELLRIERFLLQGKLMVMHGFGGMGKTALAREAADWFTRTKLYDGACFVSFEQGEDANTLLSALGSYLNVYDGHFNPNEHQEALERIHPVLKARRVLLIADNLESILPGGEAPLEAGVRTILWDVLLELAAMGAGIILTSRNTAFGDGRLARGSQSAYLPLQGLLPDDAYALASHLLDDLGIDRARAPYVELRALLAQLDHHPQAIQLVLPALRVHSLSRIRADFAALLPTFVDDNASGRNRSLQASLDYSLRRLGAEQRALLSRLAVFEVGASEDDLLAITEIPERAWASLRSELEQAALLQAESVHPAIGVPFLHLHPVLVPYLRSQPGADQDASLRQRYAQRYYGLATYLYNQDSQHPEPMRALARRELPNLRHALALLLEEVQWKEASVMTEALARFLTYFGMLREREQWRKRLTKALAKRDDSAEGTLNHAEYLHEIGQAQDERQRGNIRAAFTRLSSLLARIQAQPVGTPCGPGSFAHCRVLDELGLCLRDTGQLAAAEARFREALDLLDRLLEQTPDEEFLLSGHATLFDELGAVLMVQGRYVEAREAYDQAFKGYSAQQETRGAAATLEMLGMLAQEQGEYVEARSRFLQALEQFEDLGEPDGLAIVWYNLGSVALAAKDLAEAERCLRECLALNERMGNVAYAARCCNLLALVAERAGHPEEAEGWYQGTLVRIKQVEPGGITHAICLSNLANLLVTEVEAETALKSRLVEAEPALKSRLVEARRYIEECQRIEVQPGVSAELWKTFNILARIAELEEDQEAAHDYRWRERESYASFAGNRAPIDQQHGSLIAAIAQAAQGDQEQRANVDVALPRLEQAGWHIRAAVEHIWAGERDWSTLADELDLQDALLILRVLEMLDSPLATPLPEEETLGGEELLTSLPSPIREALTRGDEASLQQAFEALSPDEQQQVAALLEALQEGEAAGEEENDAGTSLLSQFEPLLQAIAAVAAGGEAAHRNEIEQALTELEVQGWHLKEAIERIWEGERDAGVLTEGLDEQDSALIARTLELLDP